MVLVQNEPKKIYLGQNVADMQGPCPTGFHVPTQTERGNLISLLSTLGITTGNNMKLYLKLPFAGIVYGSTSWDKQYLNVYGSYYASSPAYESGGLNRVKGLQIDASNINNDYSPTRNTALPIRPFKDIPSIPDGSRTALYSDKIYHNSTLGLISISDDGTNRITIADKNLGATVVYNDGDTLSEANCGKYYQWGNNYGFPFTGAVTTSGTQVNAQNYGPGNYYSSSTFIYNNTNYDWSSVSNPNLRGGATKEIKRIMMRPGGVEKLIRPVGGGGWQPGANTIAYWRLNGNTLDSSGNNRDLSVKTGSISYGVLSGGQNYGIFDGNTILSHKSNYIGLNRGTLLAYIYYMSNSGILLADTQDVNNSNNYYYASNYDGSQYRPLYYGSSSGKATAPGTLQWFLFAITQDGTGLKYYKNGTLVSTISITNFLNGTSHNQRSVGGLARGTQYYDKINGYISDIILEDKARTADEITNYYNQTKGNYGL